MISYNPQEGRPLQVGDRMEMEISFFMQPRNGRNNYYGTTFLYMVGEGLVPWEEGPNRDSYPLPEHTWMGGKTTIHHNGSDEPKHAFKQMATNTSPTNGQPFMLGRRLHHTDFGNGMHSEAGNPIFHEHMNKMGTKFINRSCVDCHVNNGRALPPEVGANMFQTVMKVGSDAAGSLTPRLGLSYNLRVLVEAQRAVPPLLAIHIPMDSMEMEHLISCVNQTIVLAAQRPLSIQPV